MLMVAGASPALVSSLLIHGDQLRVVRCLAFGQTIRCLSLSSHLSIGMQFKTRSSSPRCALLARSPSSQWASFHIPAYRPGWHSLTPAWTVAGNGFTSYRDAADLMALQTAGLIFFAPVLYCTSRLNPRLQVAGLPHGLLCLLPTPHRLRHGTNLNIKNQAVQNFF